MKHLLAITLLTAVFVTGMSCNGNKDTRVERIWDNEYSAFPSIVRYRGALYVSFREGASHIFDESGIAAGKTRILRSADGRPRAGIYLASLNLY